MAEKTIRHALFTYTENGRQRVALRGATVELSAEDTERGDRLEAFMADTGTEPPAPTGAELPGFPVDGTQVEQDNWVDSAKVDDLMAAANASEGTATVRALLDAESRRGDKARSTATEPLAKLLAARS